MAKPLRDDLYGAMYAALTSNAGFIYRGRDKQTGPQAGLGTLLMLERRRWVRLVRVTITTPGTGQRRREVAGAWILPLGRSVLRDEITRRGHDMPARLVLPARPRRTPAPTAPPRRPVTPTAPARPRVVCPTRTPATAPERPARVSITADVDPFELIATASPAAGDNSF
jgi:hypothetical protein